MARLLKLIAQLAQSPARTLAHTLTSWLEPIVRMWRTSQSNGITEGFHTKMEMMSRRAYGFRNFEKSLIVWRTEGDSNPRYACDVYTLSRRAPSTARPPVRDTA